MSRLTRGTSAVLVLLLLSGLSWAGAAAVSEANLDRDTAAADRAATSTADVVSRRMSQYSETLHAVAGFLAVEPSPARAEFDHFLDTVAVDGRLPGVQATGVADRVRTEDLPAFTAAVSADTQKPGTAYPPFTIRPETPDPEHMVISYLHPQEGNEAAFGFDFLAETSRRDAVLRARDSGSLAATSPVVLVQETGNQRGYW